MNKNQGVNAFRLSTKTTLEVQVLKFKHPHVHILSIMMDEKYKYSSLYPNLENLQTFKATQNWKLLFEGYQDLRYDPNTTKNGFMDGFI